MRHEVGRRWGVRAGAVFAFLWPAMHPAMAAAGRLGTPAPPALAGASSASDTVKITALGLGALRIEGGGRVVYVDAFFESQRIDPFDASDGDVILVTHDHADHFDAGRVAVAAKRANAIVVGPPSIAYPLLVTHALPARLLRIVYDQSGDRAAHADVAGVGISAYATRHFFDDQDRAIHNSYLVVLSGRRVLVAGDSNALSRKALELRGVDALLWNFVIPDKDLAKVSELEEALACFAPKVLLPVHLMDCDWTVGPEALKQEVARRKLDGVVVMDKLDRSRCLGESGLSPCP